MEERNKLIEAIENLRDSKVITYVTSDRQPPFGAKIANDAVRIFYEHLNKIGHVSKIDLFVHSLGGDTMTPWRLVNLIREFCDNFAVLVPYKAHSAATLTALGADEIVMGPMGELTPIDPTIGTPFNPPHPENPNEPKVEIGVEDVMGYINLAKEKIGITDQDNLVKIYEKLGDRIHPLAIGGVYRSHALIRLLASKILKLHMKEKTQIQSVPTIVDHLVEKLYYHNYLISRNEVEELGLKLLKPPSGLENAMWNLYLSYEKELELGKLFNPQEYLKGEAESVEIDSSIALIESMSLRSSFDKKVKISKAMVPAAPQVVAPQFSIQEEMIGWKTIEIMREE